MATMAQVTTSIETARAASKLSGRGTGYNIATPNTHERRKFRTNRQQVV